MIRTGFALMYKLISQFIQKRKIWDESKNPMMVSYPPGEYTDDRKERILHRQKEFCNLLCVGRKNSVACCVDNNRIPNGPCGQHRNSVPYGNEYIDQN